MSNFEKLKGRLAAGETVLMDGGMGSEFERRGLASPTTWSGGPMLTHPELVRDIHQEYIEAGAEIIITNTFGTGRDMLEEGGLEHKVTRGQQTGNRSGGTGKEKLRDRGLGGHCGLRVYDGSQGTRGSPGAL